MLGFISDLHLDPNENKRTEAFLNLLSNDFIKYEALFILGDLFEYWVGDDDNSSLAVQVKKSLKKYSNQGNKIYFIHINHTNPILTNKNGVRDLILNAGFNIAEKGLKLSL